MFVRVVLQKETTFKIYHHSLIREINDEDHLLPFNPINKTSFSKDSLYVVYTNRCLHECEEEHEHSFLDKKRAFCTIQDLAGE